MGFERTSSEALSSSCGSGATWAVAVATCVASTAEVTTSLTSLTSSGRVEDFSGAGATVGIGVSRGTPRADPFSTGLSACPGTKSTCSGSTSGSLRYDGGTAVCWGYGIGGFGGAVYTLLTKP